MPGIPCLIPQKSARVHIPTIENVIREIRQNGKQVQNKKHPDGLRAVTEEELLGIETKLDPYSLPDDLRKLFQETAQYRYPGYMLLSPYLGTESQFIKIRIAFYEEGLPKDWIAFCDTGNYVFCISVENTTVRAWDSSECDWNPIADQIEQWDSLAAWAAAEWVDLSSVFQE